VVVVMVVAVAPACHALSALAMRRGPVGVQLLVRWRRWRRRWRRRQLRRLVGGSKMQWAWRGHQAERRGALELRERPPTHCGALKVGKAVRRWRRRLRRSSAATVPGRPAPAMLGTAPAKIDTAPLVQTTPAASDALARRQLRLLGFAAIGAAATAAAAVYAAAAAATATSAAAAAIDAHAVVVPIRVPLKATATRSANGRQSL